VLLENEKLNSQIQDLETNSQKIQGEKDKKISELKDSLKRVLLENEKFYSQIQDLETTNEKIQVEKKKEVDKLMGRLETADQSLKMEIQNLITQKENFEKENLKFKNNLDEAVILYDEMDRDYQKIKSELRYIEQNQKLEEALVCPLTQESFQDPVLARDGVIYERKAIKQWLAMKAFSPMRNEPMTKSLRTVFALKGDDVGSRS